MKAIFFGLLMIVYIQVAAQSDSTKIQINQVEVIKTFEAILEDAKKIQIKSVLPVQKEFNPQYKYDISIVPIELKYPDPQIKPLAMDADAPFKVNKGFIQAGYGLRKNPEVMAGYHTSKKDSYEAGFIINYESLDNSSKNPYQKYRDAGLDLHGSYMIKENMKLYGHVTTDFRKRYFYHTDLNIDSLYNEENSARTLNRYIISAGVANAEPTRFNINYDLNLSLKNLQVSNDDARENGITIAAKVEKLFKKSTVLALHGKYEYTAFNGINEASLSTATFKPILKTRIKNLIIHAGANLLYSSDGQSSVFPDILLSYGVAGPNLQVFAGIQQDYYSNTFQNVTVRNPYLNSNPDSLQNSVFRDFYGGVKGQFSFLTYQIKAGYKDVRQQMFLLNNSTDLRYFDMLYDDVGIVFVSGNLDFAVKENITFGGWLTQNIFNLEKLSHAWHMPNLEANAYANVALLDDKLTARCDLYFGNNVSFINKENVITPSNVLFDLNLTAAYNFTEKIGIFVKGINLLDNKFERWYGYPSVGINGMAGVKVIF
jgi:hypothetical protein